MNHSGDTNKMVGADVSNEQMIGEATPNEELRRQILSQCVAKNEREWWAARTIENLEFELNAANQRIKQLEDARTVAAANSLANMLAYEDAVAKIKRLEEAGDALYELCDPSPIQFDLVDQIPQRLKAWEEAKEAKP